MKKEIFDLLYGKIEIKEPVILELINAPSLVRLKEIDQAGYSSPFLKKKCHSRFDHSVGVMILLRKFGASLEEQIAGLIHDVSHSVFSHCIDYVLDEGSEKKHSWQDSVFEIFVKNSEIPKILKKHHLNLDFILNDKNFPLKERELPDLCADRIDYSLRTAYHYDEIDFKTLNYFLENLKTKDKFWVFKNFKSAKKYGELFLKLNRKYYAGFLSAVMFKTTGDCLKYALKKGYLLKNDFFKTDKEVLKKIKENLKKDSILKLLFERMEGKIKIKNNPKNYDASCFCKSRIVDPLFEEKGILKRLSQVDRNWKKILTDELKPKQYFLKFEK